MSQTRLLRELDAEMSEAFLDVGAADDANYQHGVGPIVSCTVRVDRAAEIFGDDEVPIAGRQVTITFELAEVAPAVGGIVTLDPNGEPERFRLGERLAYDESLSTWIVTDV